MALYKYFIIIIVIIIIIIIIIITIIIVIKMIQKMARLYHVEPYPNIKGSTNLLVLKLSYWISRFLIGLQQRLSPNSPTFCFIRKFHIRQF